MIVRRRRQVPTGDESELSTIADTPFLVDVRGYVLARGEVVNLWPQAMNEAYGTNIPLLTDLEILTLAGIGNESVEETFAPATDWGSYTEFVPETVKHDATGDGHSGACSRPLRRRVSR